MKISRTAVLFILSGFVFILGTVFSVLYDYMWGTILFDFMFVISRITTPISLVLFIVALFTYAINEYNLFHGNIDKKTSDIEKLSKRLLDDTESRDNKDIMALMLTNMSEIRQYYSMSKRHAQLAFGLAFLFCILGFALFAFVIFIERTNTQSIVVGIIGGSVSNIIAGTAFVMFKNTVAQFNHYYEALHENERFLSAVHLVDRLTPGKQDEAFMKIIEHTLSDISTRVGKKDTKKERNYPSAYE